MSTDQGFILFPRQYRDHPLFQKPDKMGAWLWLMLAAAHTAKEVPAVNRPSGELVHLEPGQLTYSIRFLMKAWGWSDGKVQRFLTCLERDGLVILATTGVDGQTTTGTTTGQTIITICDWETIQRRNLSATTGSTTGTTTGSTTNKKQLKQLKKNTPSAEGFDLFWKAYPLKVAKQRAEDAYAKIIDAGLISEPDLLAKLKAWIANWSAVPEGKRPYAPHAATWLNGRRWQDVDANASQIAPLPPVSTEDLTDAEWQSYLQVFHALGQWPADYLGPKPRMLGCRVPSHLIVAPVQEGSLRAAAATPMRRDAQPDW